ncbi:MAG: hypothetical protein JJU28_10275 [Cyclobacteriaceae bacterium]|nr:hypothetical protein [Cyclobacteriaceae bacterium]
MKVVKKESGIARKDFLRITSAFVGLPFLSKVAFFDITQKPASKKISKSTYKQKSDVMKPTQAFSELKQFPFLKALFGRRARRFGMGMEIPSGPLAYKSRKKALPLSETEQMLLIAAATGVSGWNFGVPFGPQTPDAHAEFTLRYTGRTAPTAAGLGTPALFYTDDFGCYCTQTRDIQPLHIQEFNDTDEGLEHIVSVCRENTMRIQKNRLDLPSKPPYILPPNLWWANKPGSTLFMPVGDAAEECLGILALMIRHGVMLVDQETGEPAGNLQPFLRSGLLNQNKQFPISELQATVYESVTMEAAFKGHNIVLMLQAMGLGGLFFNGMDDLSVMGVHAADGIKGLGFDFIEDERWTTPNPVGLKGVYEALCPPYYADMHAAVTEFVNRKFGDKGAYDPSQPGPWKESERIKKSVEPYNQDFVDCMSEVAQYIYEKYGKFPGIRSTILMPGFVQAHHIDTDFYDTFHREGAYLNTHAEHVKKWH